jgi:uncharacterized damage-inducible protein DinB
MNLSEILLSIFDYEMQNTRKVLERVPEDRPDFKPHEKSMAMGRLAVHVARLPQFATAIISTPSMDLATRKWPDLIFESREKLLAEFDAAAAEARGLISTLTEQQLNQPWKLSWGDKTIADMPRAVLYHTLFLNHLIHHRAQLGAYLRLNGVPVPAIYGPSADDTMGF